MAQRSCGGAAIGGRRRSGAPTVRHAGRVPRSSQPSLNREILALAVPAFATLIAEPLLILADTLIVGHLGTEDLGGLTLATSVIGLLVGLSVFLAYGTTSVVSRRLGAGDRAGALAGGVDGIFLGLILGAVYAAVLLPLGPTILGWYGATPEVTALGATYLRIVALGLPAQLVILASTGVLRGLQDTRTPLRVVVTINLINIALNVTLVYGVGLGIAGAAIGTTASQWVGAALLAGAVIRGARAEEVPLGFRPAGVLAAARLGGWLVIRNAALNLALLMTTFTATSLGTAALAAHQVINTLWTTVAFALDAFAIAAQALVGLRVGAGDTAGARGVLGRVLVWGLGFSVVVGLLLVVLRTPLSTVFSPDPAVQALVQQTVLVLAVLAPVGAIAFQLDGVLIGAGDARFLALAGLGATAAYAPFVAAVWVTHAGLAWLWVAYGAWLIARSLLLWLRTRGDGWMHAHV
ncbi:MATE family efflux transporter [Propioniciclava coleopterorum]|uniref:MATE family efflux transporter n=1 Tax=Propioniciclava coleopterorum TaxID=2714937 RepID=A0A6G7Y2U9_9ACTN|nr:MATE family efflux transporter [Propioniciclava coleopterorum]